MDLEMVLVQGKRDSKTPPKVIEDGAGIVLFGRGPSMMCEMGAWAGYRW